MNTEELLLATEQLPAKKAIVKIIDLKIDSDMRETLTRMEVMFDKVNARIEKVDARIDTLSKHMDMMFAQMNTRIDDTNRRVDHLEMATNRRMDRMDNTMRWGFGIVITLMLAMKFFQ